MSENIPNDASSRRSTHLPPDIPETVPPVVPPRPPLPPSPGDDRPARASRRWLVPLLAGLAGVLVGAVAASLITGAVTAAQQEAAKQAAIVAAEEAKSTLFGDAVDECGMTAVVEITDGGRTLIVDGEGEDIGSGDVTFTQLDCIIHAVGASDAVKQKMYETRSLDGRQTGKWDDVSASWTYHPDDGLDIIFELED